MLRGDFDTVAPGGGWSRQGRAIGALFTLNDLAKKIGLDRILGRTEKGRLALLLVFARLMIQGSRHKAIRWAEEEAVEDVLCMGSFTEEDLSAVLDWLADTQEKIERKLFHAHHAVPPSPFLYCVTSSSLEGQTGTTGIRRRARNRSLSDFLPTPRVIPLQ